MFTENKRWVFVVTVSLLTMLAASFSLPNHVSAHTRGTSENSCLTCHEDLYYLHDSGKLCCVTVHADHCAGCHEGNPTATKKEEAHLGLLLHPQENNGAKCLECHETDEVPTRLIAFKTGSGFDEVIHSEAYLPCEKAKTDFPESQTVNPFIANWKWLVGASIAFGLWLVLILFSPLKP